MKLRVLAALLCAALLGACQKSDGAANADARISDKSDGVDWPAYGRSAGEQHFSPLKQINSENVGKLGLAWSLDLGPGNSVTAPIAVDGVLYFATGYSVVHAVDAKSGKLLWTYDPKAPEAAKQKLRQGWGSRGIAWWNGKIYTGTQDGRLIAIDAKTGKPVWSTMTVEESDSRYITGAPRVFRGIAIIGHGGGDVGKTRGYATAYDAETGKQLWRFYTVPGNPADGFENAAMEAAAKTWSGEWWKLGGGGTVWNAITYDEESDTIYLGTGNGSPWNQKARGGPGDNLYLCSIIAVDAKTGAYKWHYQFNPGDTWDYNAAMDMQLAELKIGGQARKVVMTAPKNGFFYVIDRTNGKLISAEPYVKVNWASKIDLATGRPVENPKARYQNGETFVMWPAPIGAHSWQPMAFSPKTELVYIPAIQKAASWTDYELKNDQWEHGVPNMGVRAAAMVDMFPKTKDPGDGVSFLVAWDPKTQKEKWRYKTPGFLPASVMASGGGLVFQGGLDGQFNAFSADAGTKLWSFPAQAAVMAPPISYSIDGKQYVTVLTGLGTSGGLLGRLLEPFKIDYRTQKRRVLTFVLDGKATLPPLESLPLSPIADPGFVANAASADRGAVTFGYSCGVCHGYEGISAGIAPDLRASEIPQDAETFASIVRDGGLVFAGMPRFDDFSAQQLADIRQYIRTRADDFRKGRDAAPHVSAAAGP